jgi:hypothetical protein
MFDPVTDPSHVAATCCQTLSLMPVVDTRDGDETANVSIASLTPVAPFIEKNEPPLLLSLSMMRPLLPPPAERGLIQAATVMPCVYRLDRPSAPEADTYPLPPFAKFSALADSPGIHCGALIRVPVLPEPESSVAAEQKAIRALLDNYTKAVSTRNQPLFESLLLNEHIPFSHASSAVERAKQVDGTQNYEQFRKGVFAGPPFTQRFQDIHITQDGSLAQVSLIFVNTSASGVSWGWKTLQLLEVDGQWKIASEFFTTH